MSKTIRPLVAGNWKMNGVGASVEELRLLAKALAEAAPKCEVMVCPPTTLLSRAVEAAKGSSIRIGAQDCHWKASGAHTGDVSSEMIQECGGQGVIVGHSERRTDHGETDNMVKSKAEAAHRAGLVAIVCIGETLDQRKAGETLSVVSGQLKGSFPQNGTASNTVIAYEPVWAIGTGLTPTTAEVAEVHTQIRRELEALVGGEGQSIRILYGGSVKPSNAAELMGAPNVDGALVGGASLKAADFMGIIKVYN